MKWCRVQTPDGPRFGVVEGETVALMEGSLFDRSDRTGETVALAQAVIVGHDNVRRQMEISDYAEVLIAAGMIRMQVCVDHEADRLV